MIRTVRAAGATTVALLLALGLTACTTSPPVSTVSSSPTSESNNVGDSSEKADKAAVKLAMINFFETLQTDVANGIVNSELGEATPEELEGKNDSIETFNKTYKSTLALLNPAMNQKEKEKFVGNYGMVFMFVPDASITVDDSTIRIHDDIATITSDSFTLDSKEESPKGNLKKKSAPSTTTLKFVDGKWLISAHEEGKSGK